MSDDNKPLVKFNMIRKNFKLDIKSELVRDIDKSMIKIDKAKRTDDNKKFVADGLQDTTAAVTDVVTRQDTDKVSSNNVSTIQVCNEQKKKPHFGPRVNTSAPTTLGTAEAFKISKYGVGAAADASVAEAGASSEFLHGLIGVKANASTAKSSAGASATLSNEQKETPHFGSRVNERASTTLASAEAFKISRNDVGAAAGASVAEAGASADFLHGLIGVKANASAAKSSAGASATLSDDQKETPHFGPRVNALSSTTLASAEAFKISRNGVGAASGASVAEASASADFLHGLIGVKANASAAKSSASASATLSDEQKETPHSGPRVNERSSTTLASAEAFKISRNGVGAASGASVAEACASADFLHGLIGVKANASAAKSSAGASGTLSDEQKETPHFGPQVNQRFSTTLASAEAFKISKNGVGAAAGASAAEAGASADFVNGVIGVEVNTSAAKASAGASASVMGFEAKANAHVAKPQCGVKNTPLQVSVNAIEAGAHAGASIRYLGASVGVYLTEAKAGPFAVRAGVKFGAAIQNGVPVIDVGPVTTPCSIM